MPINSKRRAIKLVPIMVGSTNAEKEAYYGKLLGKYLDDENTIFIISSDFCHWGKRWIFFNCIEWKVYQYNCLASAISTIKKKMVISIKASKNLIWKEYHALKSTVSRKQTFRNDFSLILWHFVSQWFCKIFGRNSEHHMRQASYRSALECNWIET